MDYLLGSKYEDFFLKSNVARLDIAADFKNLKMDDLVRRNLKQRRSGMYWDQHGNTQTIYLGDPTSNVLLRIYDKTAKAKSKGKSVDIEPVTRIETTIKPHCSFRDIPKISNPFEGLMIYKLSDLIADQRLPISFCDTLSTKGG